MKRIIIIAAAVAGCWSSIVGAQTVTFDFENASQYSPLPISLTVGGITAHFSANPLYYNYSIQRADVLGFTPAGFAGLCIAPSGVYASDLLISFDRALSDASILYAPEEYATDSSCTMRITAYYGDRFVATATHTIDPPGTWPSGILGLTAPEPFTQVVIHYDKPPVTGGDYGPIFMADNLAVTPWTLPYARIDSVAKSLAGSMVLRGVSVPFATVTISSTTSLSQPFQFLANVTVAGDGSFQFEDIDPVNVRFYRVTYP